MCRATALTNRSAIDSIMNDPGVPVAVQDFIDHQWLRSTDFNRSLQRILRAIRVIRRECREFSATHPLGCDCHMCEVWIGEGRHKALLSQLEYLSETLRRLVGPVESAAVNTTDEDWPADVMAAARALMAG